MIKRLIKFGLPFFIIMITLISCTPKPYWVEHDGMFDTCDIARAQQAMPFTVVIPDYMPEIQGEAKLPLISGTLGKSSSNGQAEINLLYPLKYSDKSVILITECNYVYTLGYPEMDPELELVNMQGKQVVRGINNEYSVFSFNENGVYYIVDCRDVPVEEALKVLESMLKQL
jgi:hypothetical protein